MPGACMVYTGEPTTQPSELVEQWIADPSLKKFTWDQSTSRAGDWSYEQRWVNLAALSPTVFSRCLQIGMNSFWDASVGSDMRMGNLTLEQMDNMSKNASFTWNATELTGIKHDGKKYVCNIAFASITIAISFALFIAPDTSLVLGIVVKAPDTLGFVSTSARNNPYVDQQVKSRSDGLQAARALRDLRVRVGDVREDSEVGHVVFTTADGRHAQLSRKRLYD